MRSGFSKSASLASISCLARVQTRLVDRPFLRRLRWQLCAEIDERPADEPTVDDRCFSTQASSARPHPHPPQLRPSLCWQAKNSQDSLHTTSRESPGDIATSVSISQAHVREHLVSYWPQEIPMCIKIARYRLPIHSSSPALFWLPSKPLNP